MTLSLTKQQQEYLNKNGPLKARELKSVFKKSVKEQEKIVKQAAKIRKASK